MAGTSLNFDISGLDGSKHMIADMQARALDTEPLMKAIAFEGEQSTRRRFDRQEGPDGKAWVPSMAAKRANRKTLIDTRHFRDETFSSEATAETAIWGTNAVQGRIFQLGGVINMPARQGTARLRLEANGQLTRQGASGRAANLARFAKPSHRRVREVNFKAEAYTITVTARPFLGLDAADRRTFTELVTDHYTRRTQ